MIRRTHQLALTSALAIGLTASALAQGTYRTAEQEVLPAGTVLKVKLDQRLNSATARPGQRFWATAQPEEDRSGLPEGTRVEGVVRAARPASKEQPGVLDVDFTGLRFPNGRAYAVNGSLASLDAKSVSRTSSGRLVSKRDTKSERMKFIGYGAGAGALIGILTGGNAIKSALLGAAGGYLYDQLNKDKSKGRYVNVDLKEGAEFGVRLDQRFAFAPSTVAYRDDRFGEPVGRRDRRDDRLQDDRVYRDDRVNGNRAGIGVVVDDREVNFGAARPMRVGQTVLVPLAPVMNAAGARFSYDRTAREINVSGSEGNARLTLGSSVAWVNGRRVSVGAPARMIQNTLYVPERFIAAATGMQADWDEGSQTLLLNSRSNGRFDDREGGL